MTALTTTTTGGGILQHDAQTEQLIREQFGLGSATAPEIAWFFGVANRLRLDPFQKQIYAIMRYDGKLKREKLTIQVSIDGYRTKAAETREYAGSDDAVFVGDNGQGGPAQATVTVYRLVQGVRCPFTATARFAEYVQTHSKTGQILGQWASKPFVMLAKCAEALALRKAFPAELGGTYTDAEMSQADAVEAQEVAGLTDAQASKLRELSEQAGVAPAIAAARIESMKPSDYDKGVAALEQRIKEQGTTDSAASETTTPCAACEGSGSVEGDTCGACAGSGVDA